jgi:hypothetical protein
MLGRQTYTQKEIDDGRSAVQQQMAAYNVLIEAIGASKRSQPALEDFEALLFNNLTLMLDRRFVHRVRNVSGKDGNPLNEVELICDSLMNNDGVMRTNNVIKYIPEKSVLKLGSGDQIRLSAEDFERLSAAFLTDLGDKFLQP